MSEPLPPTSVPQESLAYQPVSGWAVAGFAVGALFALLVTVSAIVGLFQGVPVFFPIWITSVAGLGIVLSWIGIRQVQNSEGTRAGAKLARIGIWLSLVSGLCYFSYYFFTRLAQESQANAFLMEMSDDGGFFPRLKEGATKPAQINAAFLLTLPAHLRSVRPEDEYEIRKRHDRPTKEGSQGLWTSFTDGVFPRLFFKQLAADAEVTPGVVRDWNPEGRGCKVQRIYHIKTKELEADLLLTVQSTEAESAGGSRKWFVNLNESGMIQTSKNLTPVGNGLRVLRMRAYEKVDSWLKSLERGQPFSFKDVDQTVWDRLYMIEKEGGPTRAAARAAVTSALSGGKNRLVNSKILARPDDIGKWEQDADGKVRIYYHVHFGLTTGADGSRIPPTEVDAQVVLQTSQAIDLPRFDPAAPAPEWDIRRIVITNVAPSPETKGPGGM